ncbi:MAG: S1C family serine protease [Mycobacterium sp.]|nr:S1C family serine protease [Mycobacterium sp.]
MRKAHAQRWLTAMVGALSAVLLVSSAIAAAEPADLSGVADQIEPSVVRLDTVVDYQHVMGTGTGFVIDPAGQVLTNYHVVQGADVITAVVGDAAFGADIIGYDRGRDIAVLQLRGTSRLPSAAIGDSGRIAIGEPVIAIGNARGSTSPLTRESGTVTALGRTISAEDALTGARTEMTGLFAIAAPVRAGDSGGPVVNGAGQVIGVTTAATINFQTDPGGEGFAIPINDAMAVANQIRARAPTGTVHIGPPTLIGVGVRTGEQSEAFRGVIVHEVLRGGPADLAGLADGDVILTIDETPIESAANLTQVLDRHYPGDVIGLTWIDRAGRYRTGKATLTAGA